MEKHSEVKVIEEKFNENFETNVNNLLNSGWQIISSNCATQTYDDKSVGKIYQAILIKLVEDKTKTPPPAAAFIKQ